MCRSITRTTCVEQHMNALEYEIKFRQTGINSKALFMFIQNAEALAKHKPVFVKI